MTEAIHKNAIDTEHHLDFGIAEWHFPAFTRFEVGTCHGLYRFTNDSIDILAIDNNVPGNGHLNDVFQWFEYSCRTHRKILRVLECWNEGFRQHLIKKRGFKAISKYDVEKIIHT